MITAGVDEAGRGPLAGPVVAACVVWNSEVLNTLIADSKMLTPKKREKAFAQILSDAVDISLGFSTPAEIDKINIRQATLLAMKRAVLSLRYHPDSILIDGVDTIPGISIPQRAVVGGDRKVIAISAASIVAKVLRDWTMMIYDHIFPYWDFAQHKGYGTRIHIERISALGASPIHRASFIRRISLP